MDYNKYKIFRKKLLSFLSNDSELLAMAQVKLMTTNKKFNFWLYSDLEGIICLILNYKEKAPYLALYNFKTIVKLFEIELYKDFSINYQNLAGMFWGDC